jgi:hypothetical protein
VAATAVRRLDTFQVTLCLGHADCQPDCAWYLRGLWRDGNCASHLPKITWLPSSQLYKLAAVIASQASSFALVNGLYVPLHFLPTQAVLDLILSRAKCHCLRAQRGRNIKLVLGLEAAIFFSIQRANSTSYSFHIISFHSSQTGLLASNQFDSDPPDVPLLARSLFLISSTIGPEPSLSGSFSVNNTRQRLSTQSA